MKPSELPLPLRSEVVSVSDAMQAARSSAQLAATSMAAYALQLFALHREGRYSAEEVEFILQALSHGDTVVLEGKQLVRRRVRPDGTPGRWVARIERSEAGQEYDAAELARVAAVLRGTERVKL